MTKYTVQIFIAIIILVACFKLWEIKGRWDIARQIQGVNNAKDLVQDLSVYYKPLPHR